MAQAARKQPLILVSGDYDPDAWRKQDEAESEFLSWVAVTQDMWGRGCFGAGQAEAVREAANGLTMNKTQIIGAIGLGVGGVAPVAKSSGTYIEVFETDQSLLDYEKQDPAVAGKFLKLDHWSVEAPGLREDRYHGLMAMRAISTAADFAPVVTAIAAAVKQGGRLFTDELYAADPAAGALVAQAIAAPNHKLYLHPHDAVMEACAAAKLESRSKSVANDELMGVIREGLSQAQEMAQRLKTIPQPFRKQRMMAFADELQRAAVLHHALEKGLVSVIRTIHYKERKL